MLSHAQITMTFYIWNLKVNWRDSHRSPDMFNYFILSLISFIQLFAPSLSCCIFSSSLSFSSFLLRQISPSITLTSPVTSCQMTSPEYQVCSMLFFVCSLPVFLRAALWYSQQVAHLVTAATAAQRVETYILL